MLRVLHILSVSLIILAGCQDYEQKEVNIMPSEIKVRVGEPGEQFASRYPDQVSTKSQHGISFFDINWSQKSKGVIKFKHGAHSLRIENILGVTGVQDSDYPHEGISSLRITTGITGPNGIAHDDARKFMIAILQRILQAGWKNTIPRSRPRLRGRDMLNYLFNEKSTSLDAEYAPTLEEWMRLESHKEWSFYADHVYLDVSFMREHTLTDVGKPGAYLILLNFTSEAEFFRGYVDSEYRQRWKELLPEELKKVEEMRAKEEARMRAKGFKIDES